MTKPYFTRGFYSQNRPVGDSTEILVSLKNIILKEV